MSTDKKVALITGGNKGIGLETARQLGKLGITVLIGVRDVAKGEAAVAELKNCVWPATAPLTVPVLLVKELLPAVEVLLKCVRPPPTPKTVPPSLVKVVRFPAVALLLKVICPKLLAPSTLVTKFCMVPELFVIPVPLMVSVKLGLTVMV